MLRELQNRVESRAAVVDERAPGPSRCQSHRPVAQRLYQTVSNDRSRWIWGLENSTACSCRLTFAKTSRQALEPSRLGRCGQHSLAFSPIECQSWLHGAVERVLAVTEGTFRHTSALLSTNSGCEVSANQAACRSYRWWSPPTSGRATMRPAPTASTPRASGVSLPSAR